MGPQWMEGVYSTHPKAGSDLYEEDDNGEDSTISHGVGDCTDDAANFVCAEP